MSKFKIGDEIQIVTKCEYESQGLRNGKKMKGVIAAISCASYLATDEPFYNLKVNWDDGSSNSYCDKHLEMFCYEDFLVTYMKEIQEECKRRYPIGCEFIRCGAVNKTLYTLRADYDTYSINGKQIYGHSGGGLLYNDGEWAEVVVVVVVVETPKTDSFKSVDMIAIQEECKRRFPIGCTFKADGGITDTLKQDKTVYEIYENMIYAHSAAGCLYEDGKWATLVSLPDTYSIKSRDEYFPDLSKHIGRYVKVLRYAPHGGCINVGEYGKIISTYYIDFPNHKGYSASDALDKGFLNESYELMRHGFVPLDGEISGELDLIKEAQRRYPIGTKFHPVHMLKDTEFCIVTNTNFNFSDSEDSIAALTDKDKTWTASADVRYGNTSFFRTVYYNGKWAEYYDEPKIVKGVDISGSIKVSNAGIYGSFGSVVWDKEDRKTSISDVLSVDIRLSKKKKKILF